MSTPARHTTVRELVRTFGPDLWVHRRAVVAGYLYRSIAIGVTLLAPWPLKVIIDHVVGTRPLPRIIQLLGPDLSKEALVGVLAALIVALALLRALAEMLQATTNARLRERLNMQLRDRMLAHLQTLPPTIRTTHRSGELVMRLVGDVDLFIRLQIKTLPAIFEHGVTSIATMVLMFWLQPVLALVTVAMLPGLAVLVRHYGIRLGRASREKRRREGEVAGLAQEIVRGLPAIQALGGEQHARERFKRMNARSLEAGVDETRATAEMERTLRTVYGLATAATIGGGAILVLRGSLTLGALTVLATYLSRLLNPIERLNDIADTASKGFAGGERLMGLLDLRPAVQDAPGALDIGRARGVIELRDVHFEYGGRRPAPVLRGVNLRLEPGRLTLLVGRSGAGKSTLISLLVRLFDPSSGTILLDGRPLPAISIRSLRSQISMMSQDTHLFAGSLRQALIPTGAAVDDERVWEALTLVAMDEFVHTLPDRLETPLGEDGVNLSGGQRQRLSLARAFLLDRPILILDEPTSNVDAASEALIAKALERMRPGRTCLAITHRLTLFDQADVVYRLEDGKIVEQTKGLRLLSSAAGHPA